MLAGLLPRITQLSAVLTRGRVVERAVAAAGIDVDRPALSVLITLHTAGGPLRVGRSPPGCRWSGRTSPGR